uniref:Recep_L_domain domain-containing protein n=1 Tax=Heterorhabditis bacteriophora TaxID=37862 RepID=A0A1I7WZW7_HETBA
MRNRVEVVLDLALSQNIEDTGDVLEQNPYSTITANSMHSSVMKDLESLIYKKTKVLNSRRTPCFRDVSIDNMLKDLKIPSKKTKLIANIKDFELVDVALTISFVLLIIFGICGLYILLNKLLKLNNVDCRSKTLNRLGDLCNGLVKVIKWNSVTSNVRLKCIFNVVPSEYVDITNL